MAERKEKKMPEYIEREVVTEKILRSALRKCYYGLNKEASGLMEAKEIVQKTPAADVVSVVRCKDCKYYTNNIHDPNLRDNFCNRVEQNCFDIRSPNGYCNYGERIDGDNHVKEN